MRTNRPWQSLVTGNPGTLTPPANGSWTVPDWWVDPSNSSGVASDSNAGNSSASPLLHYAEIVRRWQTLTPLLRQNTVVHFMSSHFDDGDPVIGAPYCLGGTASIVGVLPAAVGSGTLLAVSPQTRSTTGNFWMATLPGAGWGVGSLIVNTTRANSRAFVYNVPGEGNPTFTQPRAPAASSPFTFDVPARHDDWTNGDNVSIYNLFRVNLCSWEPRLLDVTAATSASAIYQLKSDDFGAQPGVDVCFIGGPCNQTEMWAHKARFTSSTGILQSLVVNVFSDGLSIYIGDFPGGNGNIVIMSGAQKAFIEGTEGLQLDGDVILNSFTHVAGGLFGFVALDSNHLIARGPFAQLNGSDGGSIIWSPNGGILDVTDRCRFAYPSAAGAASTSLLCTLQLNGVTVANAYDDTADPGLWHPGRPLTPAALDADVSAGGFRSNGVSRAIDPAGASFISAGTVA